VSQVKGIYEACDIAMVAYLSKVKEKSCTFKTFKIENVPLSENRQANILSKLAVSLPDGHPRAFGGNSCINEQLTLRDWHR